MNENGQINPRYLGLFTDLYQLKINNLSVYNNLNNRGKGASIRKGIKKSIGKIVLVADADLSAPINQFDKLYDEF